MENLSIRLRSHFQFLDNKRNPKPALVLTLLTFAFFSFTPTPIIAQSPNTANMIVVVVDQNGAVVKDAKVSVINNATGAERVVALGEYDRVDGVSPLCREVSLAQTHAAAIAQVNRWNEEHEF